MKKYSALDSKGSIYDFCARSDEAAIQIALKEKVKCLIRVKSFQKSSPLYTILAYNEKGH